MDQNWYLKEWLAHFKKRQAALVNELGWDKSRANFVYHGKQPYRRDLVNEVSAWLKIEPYELLMPPKEAIALQSLRKAAQFIASGGDTSVEDLSAPAQKKPPVKRQTPRPE